MSTNLPRTIPELIDWSNVHGPLWVLNGTQIGLSTAQTTVLTGLISAFVKANSDAQIAREASKAATMTLKNAMDSLEATAGNYINTIKSFAETTHNPAVYSLAQITPDSPRGVVPEPVAPTQFGATINADGSLTINWKVAQPAGVNGVIYTVLRRFENTQPFTVISIPPTSKKTFTDTTLPFGTDSVQYVVQPSRGSVAGPLSNTFTVQFGSVMGGGGLSIHTIASTPNAETVKMAA
jgi:hypothetical protein